LSEARKFAGQVLTGICAGGRAKRRGGGGERVTLDSLTGPKLAKLIPRIAEALNRDELVLPRSTYESMMLDELAQLSKRLLASVTEVCSEVSSVHDAALRDGREECCRLWRERAWPSRKLRSTPSSRV
jgi:hypothetical protein